MEYGKKAVMLALFIASALPVWGAPAGAQGFRRTMLQMTAFPGTQYVTALYIVDVDAGAAVPRHTHPGLETLYILEGEVTLAIDGEPEKHLKPGDSVQIPMGTVHSVPAPAKPAKILVTYVVEKDKPLATIVPQK